MLKTIIVVVVLLLFLLHTTTVLYLGLRPQPLPVMPRPRTHYAKNSKKKPERVDPPDYPGQVKSIERDHACRVQCVLYILPQ